MNSHNREKQNFMQNKQKKINQWHIKQKTMKSLRTKIQFYVQSNQTNKTTSETEKNKRET